MIFYVLNNNFEKIALIDSYESAIWTDRYLEPGDFELYIKIKDSIPSNTGIAMGRYLIHKDSEHMMIIEKIEIQTDVEDGNKLIVSGRSLESILDRRIVWDKAVYSKGDYLQSVLYDIFFYNVTDPDPLYKGRAIPNFIFQETNDAKIASIKLTEDAEYHGEDLLSVVKKLCETYKIGFKVLLNKKNQFVFSLYAGVDRTNIKDPSKYVVFSPKMENLLNSNYINDRTNYKNVAYCVGPAEDLYVMVRPTGDENPKEEGWYKWDPDQNEYISTEDEYVRSDQTYYKKDDLEKRRLKEVVGSASGLNRREVYNDCSSADRKGEVTYDPAKITQWQHNPKEEGWYVQHVNDEGVIEYILAQEETPIPLETYYWKNTHTKDDKGFLALLHQMGQEKLNELKEKREFEGEVDFTNTMFRYRKHYAIGDLVQIVDSFGFKGKTRVTEYIYSDNVSDGLKCYPTFEMVE